MVQEQKPKNSRKSSNYGYQNQSSRNYGNQYNMNKIEPRSTESSYRPSNWSSYQPMTRTNSMSGSMAADAKLNSDQSSTETVRFDCSPSTSRHEHQTSPDQVRFTSLARNNGLNHSKEPNASSSQSIAQVQEISSSFREMNTKKVEYRNKETSQNIEAIPFLQDVISKKMFLKIQILQFFCFI